MKTISVLLFFVAIGFAFGQDEVSSESPLRTQVSEFDNPQRGHVHIEKTFSGDEMVMCVMTFSNVTTRSLLLHGDAKYIEADEDGDGFFESVMLPGERGDEFEAFIREKDGRLQPLPEQEYSDLREKAIEATSALREFLGEYEAKFEVAAPEPPPAAAVQDAAETMNPKPQSQAPADDGGR